MGKTIITMASWEDRFLLGYDRDLGHGEVEKILMFWSAEHDGWTSNIREEANKRHKCVDVELRLDDPKQSWHAICGALQKIKSDDVLLNISTMPREVIWIILWVLESRSLAISCVYYPPRKYGDWLTKDHGEARIVYKLGGELSLGVPTKLFVVSGYEEQRVRQLIQVYEPTQVVLGYHSGSTTNDPRKQPIKRSDFPDAEILNLSDFAFDACALDLGLVELQSKTQGLFDDSNVLMASLGPKTTAIPLFQLHRQHPNSSLVYIPSKTYNKDYSIGIGKATYTHVVDLSLHS